MSKDVEELFHAIEREIDTVEKNILVTREQRVGVLDKFSDVQTLTSEETGEMLKALSVEMAQIKVESKAYKETCVEIAEKLGGTIGKLENMLDR